MLELLKDKEYMKYAILVILTVIFSILAQVCDSNGLDLLTVTFILLAFIFFLFFVVKAATIDM